MEERINAIVKEIKNIKEIAHKAKQDNNFNLHKECQLKIDALRDFVNEIKKSIKLTKRKV